MAAMQKGKIHRFKASAMQHRCITDSSFKCLGALQTNFVVIRWEKKSVFYIIIHSDMFELVLAITCNNILQL